MCTVRIAFFTSPSGYSGAVSSDLITILGHDEWDELDERVRIVCFGEIVFFLLRFIVVRKLELNFVQ